MIISEILLNLDIPSKEIKLRFKNNQVKLNGETIDNINLDINEEFIMESGDFLTSFYNSRELSTLNTWQKIASLKGSELFGENSNLPIIDNLEAFHCLSISKNEHYILMKN